MRMKPGKVLVVGEAEVVCALQLRGKCSYYNFHELQAINLRRLDG